jgi:hypothetical protein
MTTAKETAIRLDVEEIIRFVCDDLTEMRQLIFKLTIEVARLDSYRARS